MTDDVLIEHTLCAYSLADYECIWTIHMLAILLYRHFSLLIVDTYSIILHVCLVVGQLSQLVVHFVVKAPNLVW